MNKEIVKSTILLTTLCFALSQGAFAAKNKELVRMDLDQNSDGSVKVNIYTDKPYTEQIIVNKKPDNKYVILLPETVNTMGVKPDVTGVSNVKGIDVKTQHYSSLPNKGYTKITIDGKRPIEIVPQTHVSRTMQAPKRSISEQTRSVMSQSNRRPYVTPQQVQMTVPQRVLNQSRPTTHNDFVPSYERQRQYNNSQTVTRQYSQPAQNNYVSRPVQQTRQETVFSQPQRTVQQFAQTVQQAVQPQAQQQTQLIETTQTTNNALTENEQVALDDNNNQAVDDATAKQLEANDDDITEDDLAFFKKIIRFKQKVARKIKQILSFRISFSTFMGLAQFALLIVLIKIIGDLVKRIQYPNGNDIETRPVTKRLIHNNDETFEQAYPSYSNMDVYNTSRSNFEEDNKEGFNMKPLSAPSTFAKTSNNLYSNGNMMYNQQQPASQSFIQENDFYRPLNKVSKEEKMSIFDENAEDIERTIFKNPLKQISKHEEQTLFDEDEPASLNSPFNNQEDYSIKEQEEDFFNYNNTSQQNDEDFFIFEDDENDDNIEYQEDYVDEEEDAEYDEESDEESEYEYEDEDGEEYEEEVEDVEEESAPQEPQQVSNPFEHLTVKSKFVIDSNRGFAQVSVDGLNALIGYVGSKISVIRKFNEEINDKMQVRLNEQADENTLIYIIKVGKYKTLVEVKPDSIRQLLDL